MKVKKPFIVSEGTLKTQDLVPAFERFISARKVKELRRPYGLTRKNIDDYEKTSDAIRELWNEYLNEALFPAMDELSGVGLCFGSHPGDGACFGFFSLDD